MTNKLNLNPAQIACIKAYENGEFSDCLNLESEKEFKEAIESCGDTLFKFLILELSTEEDCTGTETAIRRILRVQESIDLVQNSILDINYESWGQKNAATEKG